MNGSCLLILLILCAMNRCCGEACRGGSDTSSCGCGCGTQSVIQPRRERPENSKGDCRKEQETCCESSHAERASFESGSFSQYSLNVFRAIIRIKKKFPFVSWYKLFTK